MKTRWDTWSAYLPLLAGVIVAASLLLPALSANAQSTAAISQGFQTTSTTISPGALVSLDPNDNSKVQPATIDKSGTLAGVASQSPLVALSSGKNEVQVAIGGVTPVLVSDINGQIKSGDKITASPVAGIGMKATESAEVVGTAQEDFAASKARDITITDNNKQPRHIHVAAILAQINIAYYAAAAGNSNFLPPFIQQLANGIAGREVSVIRIMIGLLLLLAGFIGAGILLYSSVQSSIISIGRNPLSEKAVRSSLLQVGLIGLAILFATGLVVYIVLVV